MDADLPLDLKHGLEQLTAGQSHRALARRAAALSQRYRDGGRSTDAIRDREDALAYAMTRLPATYAAVAAALAAVTQVRPTFAPRTLLDVGAGPGAAAWAAAQRFPAIAGVRLIDDNARMRALARALIAASEHAALRNAAYEAGTLAPAISSASLRPTRPRAPPTPCGRAPPTCWSWSSQARRRDSCASASCARIWSGAAPTWSRPARTTSPA